MENLFINHPAWFNPAPLGQRHEADDTITESMFSCNDDLQGSNLVQYAINEPVELSEPKPLKRVQKAEVKS